MKKISMLFVSSFITIALIFAGCSAQSSNPSESESEELENLDDRMEVGIHAQPETLDTHLSTAEITRTIGRNIFETLVALDENYDPVPELADSIDVNDEATKFVFNLRKDVYFHNGKEMKAEDVVSSMNRWKENYGTAKSIFGESEFEIVDDYTVEVNLNEPAINLLSIIAGAKQIAAIMPKEIVEDAKSESMSEFIGTGPFSLHEWKQDQYIHLKKYENYSMNEIEASGLAGKKEVFVNDVFLNFITDPSTRFAGIQSGEYDITTLLPNDNYEMLTQNESINTKVELFLNVTAVFNKRDGVFSNELVRRAANAAMNSEDIMLGSTGNKELYRVDSSYMFEEQAAWHSSEGEENYNQNNIEKAKELLEEAGYNGEEVTIMASQHYPQFYNASIMVMEQLETIGMNVNLEIYDWASQQENMYDSEKYDMFFTGFTPVSTPPELLYLTPEWAGWSEDDKIAELLRVINQTKSMEEAKSAWDELQAYAWEYLPIIKFGDAFSYSGYTQNVKDIDFFQGPILWNTKIINN